MSASPAGWTREMTGYHWFVLIVASLGWLFDCLDQQLFNIARAPAMKDLLDSPPTTEQQAFWQANRSEALHAPGLGWVVEGAPGYFDDAGRPMSDKKDPDEYGGYATSIFLIGWATGGLFFGVIGDRLGRAKTMVITIFVYAVCTGLSALSTGFWDFAFYRFITGLGVGGEFAVGVALIAETVPASARTQALALLQALSAFGNVLAALVGIFFGHLEKIGLGDYMLGLASWRWMFIIGAVPALFVVFVQRKLKEPEAWVKMKAAGTASGQQVGSYAALFADPRWRKNAVVGLLLACVGVIGLWGIGFFTIDLQRKILKDALVAEGYSGAQLDGARMQWSGVASMMIQIGAFFGMLTFGKAAQRFGRKPAFAIAFVGAFFATILVFWKLKAWTDFWMLTVMGYFQLSLFAGYAIYFPELFPTRLRSTGTSFCYNVGRFVAASGPTALGLLTSRVFAGEMRYAGMTMCSIFVLGLLVLPFAPETRGHPLPE